MVEVELRLEGAESLEALIERCADIADRTNRGAE
jgi:hypothetical protein